MLNFEGLTSINFHSNTKESLKTVENEEDKTSVILREDFVPDLNNNSLTMTAYAMSISLTNKPFAVNRDRYEADVVVNGSEASFYSTGLTLADCKPCVKANKEMFENEEDKYSDLLREKLASEVNSNSLTNASNEPLAPKEDRLDANETQNGTDISDKTEEETCSISPDEQFPISKLSTNQGSEPEEESRKEVYTFSKCE